LILRQDIKISDFRRYNSKLTGYIPAQGKKYKRFGFANDDRLRAAHYPGIIAAKNGYTDAARHEFVAAVHRGGHTLIVTLMHAERYPVDTQDQAIRLFDWGFRVDGKIAPVGQLVNPSVPHPVTHPSPSPTTAAPSTQPAIAAATKSDSNDNGGGSGWEIPTIIAAVVVVAAGGGYAFYRGRSAH
jgi:D-alanyl-D-alanine carboxypeptidase (penicillin-binding protein 5/6)